MTETFLTCPQCGLAYAEPAERCSVDGSPLYGPEVMARLGIRVGNYQIHSILGEGGMGVVYRGEHVMLRRPVAIKILHERFARREGAVEQFLHEARAASQIRHPNIVDVTDFGTAPDGSVYFVMEYLEGESLEDVLARDHHIGLFDAVNIVRQTAQALAAAHDHSIVHLDLKPENIFLIRRPGRRRIVRKIEHRNSFVVEPEGDFDFVKLLDFGVARFTHNQAGGKARPGMVFGTPHYMSPEQARGRAVDGRSDIYSLGILFYEMLLGDVPFDGDSAQVILSAHVSRAVPRPENNDAGIEIDDNTSDTVMRCLEKSPHARYQSMDDLLVALQNCVTDRVFLRDAHRLPGAIEAGIVPPPAPPREPPYLPVTVLPQKRKLTPRTTEVHKRGSSAKRSLTDELSELLGTAERRIAGDHTAETDVRPEPEDGQDTNPGATHADTPTDLDLPEAPADSAAAAAEEPGRKRKATAPLTSKGGKEDVQS